MPLDKGYADQIQPVTSRAVDQRPTNAGQTLYVTLFEYDLQCEILYPQSGVAEDSGLQGLTLSVCK